MQFLVQRFVRAADADVACSPGCDGFFVQARLVGILVIDVAFLLEAFLPEREAPASAQDSRDEVFLFCFLDAKVVQLFDVRRSRVVFCHAFKSALRRFAVAVNFS